jgi:hypothetical protein
MDSIFRFLGDSLLKIKELKIAISNRCLRLGNFTMAFYMEVRYFFHTEKLYLQYFYLSRENWDSLRTLYGQKQAGWLEWSNSF